MKFGLTTNRFRASTTRRFGWATTCMGCMAAPMSARHNCAVWNGRRTVKWSEPNFGVAFLIAVDGGLLGLTESGDLVRFDASSAKYQERARASILGKPTRAASALADGRFFARDGNKLVCVKLKKE
jgi:outer membrane protein assembly factor BamB